MQGHGIEYNPLQESSTWLRATDVKDIRAFFRVQQIIFADGSRVELK